MIEMDLHLSRDRHPVVIHDAALKRTTGRRGRVGRSALETLRSLDAGSWFDSRFAGERIPTLREVLERIGRRIRLNLEIKQGWRPYPGLEEILLRCLEAGRLKDPPLISSFQPASLRRIRALDGKIPIGYLFKNGSVRQILRQAQALGAESVHGTVRSVSENLVRQAHAAGLKVYVFTVDEEQGMRHWLRLGVDGLFTNYPDRLTGVLGTT